MEKEYTFNNIDLCRQCGGTGHEGSENGASKCCELCNGSGLVQIEKKIKVTIRPHDPRGGVK